TPEIEELLRTAGARDLTLAFVPVSAPLVRGIFVAAFVNVPSDISDDDIDVCVRETYESEPFVRVPRARLPEVVAVSGSNFAEVGVVVGRGAAGARTVSVFSCVDNLVKGGAGQAIQNLNLMLGVEETNTLEDVGPYP